MNDPHLDTLIEDCNAARLGWLRAKRKRLADTIDAIDCEIASIPRRPVILPSFDGVESGGAATALRQGTQERA